MNKNYLVTCIAALVAIVLMLIVNVEMATIDGTALLIYRCLLAVALLVTLVPVLKGGK